MALLKQIKNNSLATFPYFSTKIAVVGTQKMIIFLFLNQNVVGTQKMSKNSSVVESILMKLRISTVNDTYHLYQECIKSDQ